MKKVINLIHTTPLLEQQQQYDFTIGHNSPQEGNFLYANNNPISFKDPTGLEPEGEK